MPNVHFLGARSRESLPAYLSGLDVCTIPYICNKMSESIFPLKLFEYLAAGRQVVSTALPELAIFTEHLRIARTPEEFAMSIEMSLSAPLPRVSDEFLAANSWDSKAAFLSQWVSRSVREARAAVAG
jgi:glycosyltransferase involved in cell wall biosynthesis